MRLSIIARCTLKIKSFFKKSEKIQENTVFFTVISSFRWSFCPNAGTNPSVLLALPFPQRQKQAVKYEFSTPFLPCCQNDQGQKNRVFWFWKLKFYVNFPKKHPTFSLFYPPVEKPVETVKNSELSTFSTALSTTSVLRISNFYPFFLWKIPFYFSFIQEKIMFSFHLTLEKKFRFYPFAPTSFRWICGFSILFLWKFNKLFKVIKARLRRSFQASCKLTEGPISETLRLLSGCYFAAL